MFLVLSGTVMLDFGVDGTSPLNGAYGPGYPGWCTCLFDGTDLQHDATVSDDAELGFVSSEELKRLLKECPQLFRQLLEILSAKLSHTNQTRIGNAQKLDRGVV